MKASRENVKMKTPEDEVKMAVLGDGPSTEEYFQHLNAFRRMISRTKLDEKMTKWTKAVVIAAALARKLERIPKEAETEAQTFRRLGLWEAAEAELKKAQAHESAEVGLVYDLFCKT